MTTHDVSYEYQLFFKEITEACVGCDETKRNVKRKIIIKCFNLN